MSKRFLLPCLALLGGALLSAEPVSWKIEDAIDTIEAPIPIVEPLIDYHVRDVSVCKGPNGMYYMTGTTDDNWGVNEGVRLWESGDLENWKLLGENGFVWTFDRDGADWQKEPMQHRGSFGAGRVYRGMWAPEIHYLKGNFWITYSSANVHKSGLLRSVSGKPEGPYEDIVLDGPLVDGIDATLIQDADGSVYYIWAHGRVRKMNEDMSAFTDDPEMDLRDANGERVGYEGVNIFLHEGTYYLMAAEWNGEGPKHGHQNRGTGPLRRVADGRYDCMVAQAKSLLGPYEPAYIAVPHAGHNMMFEDYEGRLWSTMFGNDESMAPFRENPALVPIQVGDSGRIEPVLPHRFRPQSDTRTLFVSARGTGKGGKSWKHAFTSVQAAIDAAGANTQIWIADGFYSESLVIADKEALYLFGGFEGSEKSLSDRRAENALTVIDASSLNQRVGKILDSSYVRIEGITFRGGRTVDRTDGFHGAGLLTVGGGETIRIVDCRFEDNRSVRNGGAVYSELGSSPLFIGCVFEKNEALRRGGAVAFEMSETNGYHARFYNCVFDSNEAQMHGGVAFVRTDHKQTGAIRFVNCVLVDNFSLLEKGAITLEGGANLIMSHCLVENSKGMSNGSSVFSLGDVPGSNRIVNTVFRGNHGGILLQAEAFGSKWLQLEGCIFEENETRIIADRIGDAELWTDWDKINEIPGFKLNRVGKSGVVLDDTNNLVLLPEGIAVRGGVLETSFPLDFYGRARTDLDFKLSGETLAVGPVVGGEDS